MTAENEKEKLTQAINVSHLSDSRKELLLVLTDIAFTDDRQEMDTLIEEIRKKTGTSSKIPQ